MDAIELEQRVRSMVDAWNAKDIDTYLGYLAEDVVWSDPAMPAPCVGRKAVAEFSRSVLRAFPDFQYSIRGPICMSNRWPTLRRAVAHCCNSHGEARTAGIYPNGA